MKRPEGTCLGWNHAVAVARIKAGKTGVRHRVTRAGSWYVGEAIWWPLWRVEPVEVPSCN